MSGAAAEGGAAAGSGPAAAPAPADIAVEFVQTGEGVPEGGKKGRLSTRERSLDAKMLLACANPACKKGGFLLRPKVDAAVREGKSEVSLELACAGYVGPLRSERGPAGGCPNRLAATVRIAWRAKGPRP